jgi:hypothetical protein
MQWKTRLGLESLEDRTVPATLRLLSGSLYISNPSTTGGSTNITLQAVANNKFDVFDNGTKVATVSVGGNIFYTGTNLNDTLTVNLQGNTFTGNLQATMSNGDDTVDIFSTGGALLGTTNVQTGLGNDTVNLNRNGAAMTFGGGIQVTDQAGLDTVNLGNAGAVTKFQSSVQLTGVNTVSAGAGQADTVGGELTITALTTDVTALNATFADNFTVNGRTTVRGGNAADTVNVGLNTFNGIAQFLLGNGADQLNFNSAGLTFNSNLDVDMGEGANSVVMSNAFTVGGSMTLRSGSGDFSVDDFNGTINGNLLAEFGDGAVAFDTAATALIAGNFTYRAGNGTSNFNLENTVAGDLAMFLGNGEGSLTTISGTAAINGRFIYRAGNGGTTVVLASTAATYNLDMIFGSGDDTLVYGAGTFVTGRVDGGGGTNTLIDGGVTFLPPYTQSNF